MYHPEKKCTLQPVTTGTSVIAVTFDGGVAIAADTLASYGKMARFKKVSRIHQVNDSTVIGVSGDHADYQYLRHEIDRMINDRKCRDSEAEMSPKALYAWLTSILYYRRCKINPLWNTYIIGGVRKEAGKKVPFLGCINMRGVAFENPYVATGISNFLVQQKLENAYREAEKAGRMLTEDEAMALLEECLNVLYYRDCVAHDQFEIGVVTAEGGSKKTAPKTLKGNWEVAEYVQGYE